MTKRAKAGTSQAAAAKRKTLFVQAFIANGENATQAAITAGYSAHTARQQGARLLTDVSIAKEISDLRAAHLKKAGEITGLSIERTLREVARLAYLDVAQFYDKEGNLLEIHEMPVEARAAIAAIEIEERFEGTGNDRQHVGFLKKLKLADKNSALDKAMKHLGQYREDNAQLNVPSVVNITVVPVQPAERRKA